MKKLAMIGCSSVGEYHLAHFLQLKHKVELAGFCDTILARAENFASRAGQGKAYTDFRKMYDEVQPDMVFICVPPFCHGEIEYETIDRRIPFFVEKPPALDLALARDIRDRIQAANLITGAGFQCRYSNLVPPTQEFLRAHDVIYVSCARMGGLPNLRWWRNRSCSGGQLVEQTIHQLDMLRYICGEPETVYTMAARGFVQAEDYSIDDASVTVVTFKNGILGTISTGCYAQSGLAYDNKIVFSAKDARMDHAIIEYARIYQDAGANAAGAMGFSDDGTVRSSDANVQSFIQEGDAGLVCDETFIDAVYAQDGSKILSPYSDAIKSLAFALACNTSIETHLPVKVRWDI